MKMQQFCNTVNSSLGPEGLPNDFRLVVLEDQDSVIALLQQSSDTSCICYEVVSTDEQLEQFVEKILKVKLDKEVTLNMATAGDALELLPKVVNAFGNYLTGAH
jgi:hypothetical protein